MLYITARFFLHQLDHFICISYSIFLLLIIDNIKRERTAPTTVRSFSHTNRMSRFRFTCHQCYDKKKLAVMQDDSYKKFI